MSSTPPNALTFNGSISFYPSDVSRLRLDSDTHGLSNHVYVYKEPQGSFKILGAEYTSGGTLCYGDMAGIKIVSGKNVGQTINRKNLEDYLAWQGEETFPQEEIIDLIQALQDAAEDCDASGASAWFRCIFSTIGNLFKGMMAATKVKQYFYQYPIVLRPGQWNGSESGGAVCSGDSVQFLMLQTQIEDANMDVAIATYWLTAVLLSMVRSGQYPKLTARFKALRGKRDLSLPDPENVSALALLHRFAPDQYNEITSSSAEVYSFQQSDSGDKKGWLRKKSPGDSDMIQNFVVSS